MDLDQIVDKISHNPRKLLNLPEVSIKKGENANMTLFNPDAEWVFNRKLNKSKSSNTPMFDQKLRGQVHGIIRNKAFSLFED